MKSYREWGRFFEANLYWFKCALIEAAYQEKKSKGGAQRKTRFDSLYDSIPTQPYHRLGVIVPGDTAYFWLGAEADDYL